MRDAASIPLLPPKTTSALGPSEIFLTPCIADKKFLPYPSNLPQRCVISTGAKRSGEIPAFALSHVSARSSAQHFTFLVVAVALVLSAMIPAQSEAQWEIEESHTTASLRGIHNVGGGVAWASGTNGTVLRTEDGGYLWQTCAIPKGAEKLDFRGIQAFDENTAIVMSSGPGDQSRLYKTTDGCQTWKLLLTNPTKTASGTRYNFEIKFTDIYWETLAMEPFF